MTRAELIQIVVPGTIVQWTAETPQFTHTGKTQKLQRMYSTYDKPTLVKKYEYLKERGYIN
jgi:hypothetical protein